MLRAAAVLTMALTALGGAVQAKSSVPCPQIPVDSAQARSFVSSANYTTGGYAMRRQGGSSRCTFNVTGRGACRLSGPGLVHVTTPRTNAYFDVPRGRSAEIVVAGGVARCRTS